jgi:nucleoside-diphosphate-sugar epimerase
MAGPVAVTGAAGFIGQEACSTLLRAGYSVRALARRPFVPPDAPTSNFTVMPVEDLATAGHQEELLAGADAVVHLAARVHRTADDPERSAQFYDRDVQMTRALALAAHRVGVRRFVYLSSIKALGDRSPNGALARNAAPKPVDSYGRAKLQAERELAAVSDSMALPVVVIRPPLVYGARASANFRELVRWVKRGIPLPLAGVHNRRSIVSVENLASFIARCLGPMDATFSLFHVSDPEPVSTPQLLRYVAAGLAVGARLFSVRTEILETLCTMLGKTDVAARLLASLELETEDSFRALTWRPPTATDEGIARAVRGMKL